jgi:anti-sigma B factor antagonist
MKLHFEHNKNKTVLRPEGEFTIYAAMEFRDALLKVHSGSGPAGGLDIDLSQAGEIDAAGLQLLLLAAKEAVAAGSPLRLVAPSMAVLETLDLCNLRTRFEIVSRPAPKAAAGKKGGAKKS